MIKMICNIIEYLNVWFVCLMNCDDFELCFPYSSG